MYNTSDVFRRMVLSPDYIAEYGVNRTFRFCFKTVFYRTSYSYRCCPCGYQHEYFDYLSDKEAIDQKEGRHIDEAMFEQIVQNIADSRCPHTNGVEEKYLTYSTVNTVHILAVLGSMESMKRVINWIHFSSIFKLNPFVNLMLKNSCQISEVMKNFGVGQFMYPIRLKDNHEIVHWKRLSVLECCARKRNKAFQHLLMTRSPHTLTCNDLACVYDLAFKYGLKELLNSLIINGFKTFVHQESLYTKHRENKKVERLIGAEAAIVYNHPKILDSLIRRLARKINQTEKENIVFICFALQRAECRKVLVNYGFPDQANLTDRDQQNRLFHMLLHYSGCREEIASIIKRNSKPPLSVIYIHGNDYQVHLNCLVDQYCYKWIGSVEFIQLMTLGEEINLTHLQVKHLDGVFRELVERCLFSNLSNINNLAEQTVNMYHEHYGKQT